ncbi:helix-turn-helix domain-containing protein [Pedobacter immunditicola]|uniref:helix-turn-helix domain-containing protein n=1 Tax=Pedobacter immunditicola TaxID=3133440 RepID=UPI0030A2E251
MCDFQPGLAVRDFVQCYRIVHFEFENKAPIPFKCYPPKPESCLHFFLRDSFAIQQPGTEILEQPSILFSGQRTNMVKQFTGSNFIDLQIVFQPTAIFCLTGISPSHLTDQHVDAKSIFPKEIQFTLEQLQEAKDYSELLRIIEHFTQNLISAAKKDFTRVDPVSRLMLQAIKMSMIDWLAGESCLCTKQFKRNFQERTGINPKTFLRIIRFNKAINMKNQFPKKDWFSIAIDCAFYDYQHLVKDFKDFTGLTPAEFHTAEKNAPESVLNLTQDIYVSRCPSLI